MIQLSFYIIFLILLFSIMGKIIYDYLKGGKLKYKSYGLAFVSGLIIFNLLKLIFELSQISSESHLLNIQVLHLLQSAFVHTY